ncbi:MAG: ABC transporter substrate binding protein, partial [Tepidiformaceae bacterium]
MRLDILALAVILVAALVRVSAPSAQTIPKVGYLGLPGEPADASPWRDAFVGGLRELGYIPGQNIIVDVRRWTTEEQLRHILSEFVRLKADAIFVGPPFAARAAKQATKEIPIVCGSCGDPIETGLATSLGRPGGNLTGLASLSAELIGKRLGLLKELLPGVSRVVVFLFLSRPRISLDTPLEDMMVLHGGAHGETQGTQEVTRARSRTGRRGRRARARPLLRAPEDGGDSP